MSEKDPENVNQEVPSTEEKVNTDVSENTTEKAVETAEEVKTAPEAEVKTAEKVEATAEAAKPAEPGKPKEEESGAELSELMEDENAKIKDTPHDDFDWELGNKHKLSYTDAEIENYLKEYEGTLSRLTENEIVVGRVSSKTHSDVVLDINYKSDGLVSISEFRDMKDLKVGDEVEVYVESQEDERGQLVLSRRKAKLLRAWETIVRSYEEGIVIQGKIVSKTKGGLIADCLGLETFLPGSQIDIKPVLDYDSYVGKTMEFKVVKINEAIKNAVVSHKAIIESDIADQREQIIAGLEKGQVLEGVVKNLTEFGAFLDLGGVDGLLYITDISWGRIDHPSQVLEMNQKLNVVVLEYDENKKRISLGLKQLQPHPWEKLAETVVEGASVKGKIVNIEDYGAFLEIEPGVEGLIHVSEVSWSNQPINARSFFSIGQEHEAKIVTLDRETRKMSLSLKQLTPDPWNEIMAKYPAESQHSGEIKNLTPYGVFVELEEGIGGMIHISDLSWTQRFSHPSDYAKAKVGEMIDVVVMEIDEETRKLSLGHKQLEENPWDTFETVFPVGSYHEATVLRKDDRGAIVLLPYGLEAFCPIKHLKKEDNNQANVDEKLMMKVLEFNRDDKRILVSHLRYLEDQKRDERSSTDKRRQQQRRSTRDGMRRQESNLKSSTLGELAAFSELKDALSDKPAAKKKEEEE